MKRTSAQTVGQIVNRLLEQEHLDVPLDEHRACALWPEIVGAGINRYTISRSVRDGVMTVRLSSAPLRAELMMNRGRIVTLINEALGRDIIKEIVFK
ncbi:MAG: DUF721 domain-containing protein [Muribaculaceae bacterium]|jgi:predicted nucleic acid-binding Zn ribbon protein|nr:DUF721 domain-containing protein [Muribaculaceae bacterium]HAP50851.1 DUF721 domain-containing protein [Porphyromonadaceae bacterium]